AELEVKRNDLLSEFDKKRNILSLEEAIQAKKQLESDIASRRDQARAQLAVQEQNRQRSVIQLQNEERRLTQVRMLAPISGLVAIRQNRTGGSFNFGQALPDI